MKKFILLALSFIIISGVQPANAGLFDWLWPKEKTTEVSEQKNTQTKEDTNQSSDRDFKKNAKEKKSKLRFTENIGQMDKAVRYHVNDAQANHYFLNNEIRTVVATEMKSNHQDMKKPERPKKRGPNERRDEPEEPEYEVTTFAYGLKFLATSESKEYLGLQPEIEKSVGKITHIKSYGTFSNIPQYGQVQYTALWEGIDVDFYETKGHLKYDFVVQPGADPSQIQFEMNGVSDLKVDFWTGELEFTTPLGELKKGTPYTYQMIDNKEVEVSAKYMIKNGLISFKLGKYNKDYPLIIDPVALKFATFLGGNSDTESLRDIYVHPTSGKIYLTGETRSTSFTGVTGTAVTNSLKDDGFITCMSKDGSTVLWTTIIGGNEDHERISSIHVSDDENDVIIAGETRSVDYPVNGVLAPYSTVLAKNSRSQIVSRLSGNGTVLEYSTYFPINTFAYGHAVVVGDIVYNSAFYGRTAYNDYPIAVPETAYISTPPTQSGNYGQLIYGINTYLSGAASYQYGTYYYDTTTDVYSFIESCRLRADAAGNIYFGGFFDLGAPDGGPTDTLFTSDAIHTVAELQNILGPSGTYSLAGIVVEFDPTLSNLIYATPIAPIMDDGYMEVGQYITANIDVSDNGDIYFSSDIDFGDIADISELVIAPANNYTNLQPLEVSPNDDLVLNVVTKISASNRSQYEYITTATGGKLGGIYTAPGGLVDEKGRLHWVFDYEFNNFGVEVDPLATSGALQSTYPSTNPVTQYVILSPTGKLDYATVIGPSVSLSSSNSTTYAYASFLTEDCKLYITGTVESNAQKSFPVTPSYWDAEAGQQVFVHDAVPASHDELWVAVFHEPDPSSNVINDFAPGNNEFCVNGLIYQDPNFGPILGDPVGYQSGDGSVAAHVLPDIRPTAFSEAHPTPTASDDFQWQISYDNGTTWTDVPNGNLEIYKPESESAPGTVQYRRAFFYSSCTNEPIYSNVATATIVGNLTLDAQAPVDPVYFCPGIAEDFTFPIVGATGNISWQWFNGFAPIDDSVINPASGSGVPPANFTATIPAGASEGGSYRLVVTDDNGCSVETTVTILPLTSPAGTGATMAICTGGATNDITLGPITPNPDFEYSWTGPGGYTSSDPNPVVTLVGTYNLQVKLTGTPNFCVGGETSVEVLPLVAHDPLLVPIANSDFCQGDDPAGIGLTGTAPAGYVFQWLPGNNLNDATAFNPTFDPGILSFGSPVSTTTYTFTALRLSDGCIFETTTTVTNTALAFANAGDDRKILCNNFYATGKASTTGDYFEWEAIATSFPGGLAALTADVDFSMDGNPANLGTNKFLTAGFPIPTTCYTIDYELRSSFLPLLNNCMSRDTIQLNICPCGGPGFFCPMIEATQEGTDGACGSNDNIISISELPGFSYVWTTYSIDGVVQPDPTEPRGLFEVNAGMPGPALAANSPHPTEVIANIDDPAWGWAGANFVVYEITGSAILGGQLVECSDRIQVFSGTNAIPVIGVKDIEVCIPRDPGTLIVDNGVALPYQLSGTDYTQSPNTGLVWDWKETGGGTSTILSGGDTPFPNIQPTSQQTYLVEASDPSTGCTTLDTFNVNFVEIWADAGDDITGLCSGILVQLGNSVAQSGYSYEWSPAAGLNFPIGTPNNTVAQPYLVIPGGAAIEYSLIVTNLETGCQVEDAILITPETNAPAAPAAATYTSCPNGELLIGTVYTPAGVDFSWSAGAGADISWLDNTTINQPTVTLPSDFTGPATFTLTVTNGTCGTAFTNYTITNVPADVELGPNVTAVCQPPYLQIGSATATPGYTYLWSPTTGLYTDAAGTIPYTGSNSNIVYVLPLVTTEYTLIANNSTTGCLFTDKITVDPPANVDLNAGDDVAYCPGESSVTIGQSGSGTTTWTATGYSSNPQGTPATPTAGEETTMLGYLSATTGMTVDFSQTTTEPGIYVYTITADNGGCVTSDEVEVVVPNLPASLSGGSKVACQYDVTQLGTTSYPGVSFNWAILNPTALSGTISDPTSATPTVDPQETTSYSLTYTEAFSGCEITETITVVVVPSPGISGGTIGPICDPISAQDLTASVTGYASLTSAVWYTNFVGGPVEATPTAVTPAQSTDYFLVGFNDDGCSTEVTVTVIVEKPATPDILSFTTGTCPTGTIDLVDFQGLPSDVSNTMEWHSDNTTNPGTIITNTVVGSGTYYIFETSPNGCFSASDSILVLEQDCNNIGSIGDYVWIDLNADGVQDGSENPIQGVMIVLFDDMGNPIDTAITDVDGLYLFDELPPGDYTVGVDPSNYDAGNPLEGYGQTFDNDGGLDDNSNYSLGFNEMNLDQDFGYAPLGSIGDNIVNDDTGNPIQGVMVVLYDDLGNPLDTAITDVNGDYLFPDLPAGDYTVTVDPTNFDPGNPLEGFDNTTDPDGGFDNTSDVTLGVDEDNLDQDFGYMELGSIGDNIVNDDTGNPIQGVMVVLYDDLGNPLDTAITDVNGDYLFPDLPAGDYTVTVDPTNFDPGNPLEGFDNTTDPDGGFDNTSDVTLGVGEDNLDQDFGYMELGSIGDNIVNDDTGNPIQGVMVVLYDDLGNPLDTAITDVNGDYLFPDLPAGDYTVTVDPTNFDPSNPLEGFDNTTDPDGGFDNTSDVTLGVDEDNLDQDFGYMELGSIGDNIVNDDTGNPIQGVMVVLYDDLGNPLDTAITDVNGDYLFPDLPAGDYTVTVDPTNFDLGNPLEGFDNTTDPDGGFDNTSDVTLGVDEDNLDQDFGYQELGSIGDNIVNDDTGNPIQGVMVVLYDDLGNPLDTAITDVNGDYLFPDLPAGDYTVTVDPTNFDPGNPLEGFDNTTDPDGGFDNTSDVTLGVDEDNLDQDFGYQELGSIGDNIVNDDTGNPIQGVMVVLYDDLGNPIDTAITDVNGDYLFPDLPAGDYTVTVDPTNFDPGNPLEGFDNTTDPDGGFDNTSDVTLGVDEDNLDQDFGYMELGSIGDNIVNDDTGNPIQGVMVVLYDDLGNPIDTAITDVNGDYLFPDLPAGDYTVTVDPTNFDPGNPLEGFDNTTDPDGGFDNTSDITLGVDEDNLDQDFGYQELGSIGDNIVNDDTGNPIQGVMVVLYDDLGNPIDTAITDVNGDYLFPDLPAGDYTVTVDPTNFDPGNPLEGFDNTTDPDGGFDNTSDVTLGVDEDNLDQDFGYQELGSIGDNISNDDTGNPIQGVMVVLYDDLGNPIDTAITDVNGDYLFPDLPAGDYTVTVDPTNFDPGNPLEGFDNTTDPDGGFDNTSDVTLGVDEDNLDQDFGYQELGSIGDNIVNEDTGNPIQGVMVVLYDDLGNPIDTAITDVNGDYLFPDLPAGDYTVTVDPTNFDPGNPLEGFDNTTDPDGGFDNTSDVTLGVDEDNLDQDFGYQELGSIGDNIVNDDTGNPIQGVMVVLYDDLGNPLDTAITDVNGDYLFPDLPAGDYTVTVDPTNFDPGNPLEGFDNTTDPDGGFDNTSDVTLGVDEDNLDQDFGYMELGSIGDNIVNDDTGNPIQGVMVVLYDDLGNPIDTAITDVNGDYLFPDLPAGDYTVTVDPTNFDPGNPLEGFDNTTDPDGGFDNTSDVTLGVDEDNLDQDFGYQELGSIGDNIVNEDTGNPIQGVMVVLYDDLGNPIDTAMTDVNGDYLFPDLPAGDYTVTVDPTNFDPGNPLEGFDNTTDPDGGFDNTSDVTLGVDEDNLDQDFGYQELGSIGDNIVNEDTGNPIQGVMVVLYDDLSNPIDTAITDVNGDYLFPDLPAGDYTVTVDPTNFDPGNPLEGFDNTTDPDGGFDNTSDVTLGAGEDNLDQDFGYQELGSIGDNIVNEDTGNPIQGVMVVLYDDLGNPIDTAMTDVNGDYLFPDLPAGDYTVTVDPTNFDPGNPLEGFDNTTDPDGGFDNTSDVTLGVDEDNLDQDFGYQELGSIGDNISNGDTGNPIQGVMVVLYDDLGNPLDTAMTDVNGDYLFPDLPAGDYTVTVDPTNFDPGNPLEGFDNTTDPDGGFDNTSDVTLGVDEDNLDQDFGYQELGSIGDNIVNDDTGNPIQGVMVVLYDDLGNPLDTAITDVNGDYLFPDLPAGDYTVTVDPTNFDLGNPLEGFDNTTDPDGGFDNTSDVTLGVDEDNLDQDFGYQELGSIGDNIVNDDTGNPIQGVMVVLYDDLGNPIDTAMTDVNGDYLFPDLPAGDYTVTVDPTNFDPGNPLEGFDNTTDPDGGFDNTSDITLGVGEDDLDQDFGYQQLGSIGDNISNDDTGNPIQGVMVVLYDDLGNPIDTAMTDVNGDYLFPDLPAGDYTVTVDPTNFNSGNPLEGFDNTTDPDGGFDNTSDVTLGVDEDNLDQDFGYQELGSIGDNIINEDTGNPIQGVMVVLYDDLGNPIDTAITDVNGDYLFPDLPAGDYTVTVDPTNFNSGNPLEGFDNTTDPDGGFDNTSDITLGVGEDNLDQDFGYMELGSIGDNISNGGTGNPIQGVMVVLYDDLGNPIDTAVTDVNGDYLFPDLPAGDYTVTVDPTNFDPGNPLEGFDNTTDPDGGFDNTSDVTLGVDEDNLDQDFGYMELGSIGDNIVNEDTGNPIQGVMVVLYDDLGNPIDTAITDVNGDYLFPDLPAGDYTVTVDPTNFDPGNPLEGFDNTTDPDGGFDNTSDITLGVGEDNQDQDFGYMELGSIGDNISNGGTGNPIQGVMVVLYDDLGNPLDTAITDVNGDYLFPDLPAGDYTVTVDPTNFDPGNPLEGFDNTTDPDGGFDNTSDVTLGVDEDNLDQDFGYMELGSIGDNIVNDDTGNPIQGVMVVLYDDLGNPLDTAITDVNGDYLFPDLPAGDYTVTVDPTNFDPGNPLEGFDNTTDPDGGFDNTSDVTLGVGEDNLDQDFDYMELGSIGDNISNAGTGNPIQGIMVVLYDDLGNPLDTAITDVNGDYLFPDLPAGDYTVTVDPTNFDPGNPLEGFDNTTDPDGGFDNTSDVTLGVGEDNLDQDFDYMELGSIGDNISNAGTGNPIQGIMVVLYDDLGNPLDTAITDVNGDYLFPDLPAGDYTVTVDPTNFDPGNPLEGFDNMADPDGGFDNTSDVTLGVGEDNQDQDFDYMELGSIGNNIVNEDTGNPIQGVMVVLYDDLGNPLDTAVTDVNGDYLFPNLPAGDYTTTVDATNFDPGDPLEGFDNTTDPDGGFDNTSDITLGVGEDNQDQDFGYMEINLPIELVSFSGKVENCEAKLWWKTATETNFSHFEVQNSRDGVNFETIGTVDGQGTDSQGFTYEFVDNISRTHELYRLKSIDLDGTFNYSNLINLTSECGEGTFISNLYPNPIQQGNINFQIALLADSKNSKAVIVDVLGRVVLDIPIDLTEGLNLIEINTDRLASATYYIKVYGDGWHITSKKFVKTE